MKRIICDNLIESNNYIFILKVKKDKIKMKIEQYDENERFKNISDEVITTKGMYMIAEDKSNNLLKIIPYDASKKKVVPNVRQLRKLSEIIANLQEQSRRQDIDARTGGPLIDTIQPTLKLFKEILPADQYQRIVVKVFGNPEKQQKKKLKIDQFIDDVKEHYFKQYELTERNHYLWTVESWTAFKARVMKRFCHDYFVYLPEMDYVFEKKDKNPQYSHKEQVPLQSIQFKNDGKELWGFLSVLVNPNTVSPSTPKVLTVKGSPGKTNTSYPWRWDKEEEYELLGLSGFVKTKIFLAHNDIQKVIKGIYWLPVAVDEKMMRLKVVKYENGKFDVDKDDVIGLAPFQVTDNKLVAEKDMKVISVFDKSYLYYLLELIDVALNESMREEFEKKGLTQFFALKKM